jgi:hypothetical protein
MLTATNLSCDDAVFSVREAAIVEAFAGTCGHIDIRWLWCRSDMHYFRVNWWRLRPNGLEQYIARSEFVAVDKEGVVRMQRPPSAHAA